MPDMSGKPRVGQELGFPEVYRAGGKSRPTVPREPRPSGVRPSRRLRSSKPSLSSADAFTSDVK